MPQHQDIAFGVASQTLYHDCMEGRPSSVTSVSVFAWDVGDDGTAESATTGSASVDSVNTTFDAASGKSQADPTLLNLAATTSLVLGREYLATNDKSQHEWVDIQRITSAASALARTPMYYDYSADGNSTLVGTRISITVDSTWVADSTQISDAVLHHPGYRVRWVYVVSGVTYVATTYFDLTRVPAAHTVRATSIERLLPGFINALPRGHRDDQGRALIDEAYRQFRIDLYQERIDDAEIRDVDIVDEMVMRKTIQLWSETRVQMGSGDTVSADRAKKDYWDRFVTIFKAPSVAKVPMSTDTTGAGSNKARAVGPTVR